MRLKAAIAVATTVLALAGGSTGAARAETKAAALAPGSNTIYNFFAENPGNVEGIPITGLLAGETVFGIDYRPADGKLYALAVNGNSAHLYTLIPNTGTATAVGPPATVSSITGATAFGIDFSPVSDRLRVVDNLPSGGGNANNFRMTPTGTLAAVDAGLDFTALPGGATNAPEVAVAYDRNFVGSTATTLFGIVSGGDRLVRQGGADGVPSPNGGLLADIGLLGVDTSNNAALDIGGPADSAYAILEVGGVSGLYTVNLGTGAATLVGKVGSGAVDFGGLAVELPPAPPPPPPSNPVPAPVQVVPQPITPTIEALVVRPSLFRAAKGGAVISKAGKPPVGTTVTYTLTVAATVQFSVERLRRGRRVGKECVRQTRRNRKRPACTLVRRLKPGFQHAGAAGSNSFKYRGRIGTRALLPGRYRLVGKVAGSVARAPFRIVR